MILATGAKARALNIPGLENSFTVTAWEVLSGEKDPKGPCLILGAGLVGCETADYLSEQGRDVIIVEVLPETATGVDADTKTYFSLRFQKKGVKVHTGTELRRVERKTAILEKNKEEMRIPVETVVFAVGAEPNEGLYAELMSSGLSKVRVGDCVQPRSILEAVQEGFQAGRGI